MIAEIFTLINRVLLALGWIRDANIKESGRKEVHDTVVRAGEKHRDSRKSADGSGVHDDDADLFRD